jgi:hypothetical protein
MWSLGIGSSGQGLNHGSSDGAIVSMDGVNNGPMTQSMIQGLNRCLNAQIINDQIDAQIINHRLTDTCSRRS